MITIKVRFCLVILTIIKNNIFKTFIQTFFYFFMSIYKIILSKTNVFFIYKSESKIIPDKKTYQISFEVQFHNSNIF